MKGEHGAALAHHGTVEACGVLLVAGDLEPARLVARLLPQLRGHEQLTWAGEALLVRFAAPRRLRAEHAPGYLLREEQGFLTTFPLRDGAVAFRPGSLLWLRGGTVSVTLPGEMRTCDPTDWLSLGEVELLEVASLGAPPLPPALPEHAPPADVRRVLGVAALSADAAAARTALATRSSSSVADGVRTAVQWLERLRRMLAARRDVGTDGHGADFTRIGGPSLFDRAADLGLKLLSGLGLVWLWLYPQQRYLRRLTELFERGDTLEALRHALPLAGSSGDAPARIALAPPSRRADLSFRGSGQGTPTVLPLADDWYAHLRELYERALADLQRSGHIEQAAFVQAELLRDVPGALALLERHGKLRLAAELADAKELAAGERVRLWFLAGELARAIDLAVAHDAYADAIQRLEKRDRASADRLRMMWADRCASCGDYLHAARIAWRLQPARAIVARWLEIASEEEGPTASAAWVLRLVLAPELAPRAHAALAPVLSADYRGAAAQRALLATELARHGDALAVGTLVQPMLRALLRDSVAGEVAPPVQLVKDLLKRAPVLRADWPNLDRGALNSTVRTRLETLRITLHERGTLDVRDAVALSGGRTLVALGALGTMLLSRRGTPVVHWERVPVEALVPATRGSRVITLVPSGELARVARLDLATRKLERWFELPIARHATHFDGTAWDVTVGGASPAYMRLDAAADYARALFHVDAGAVLGLAHGARGTELLVLGRDDLEQWSYELPGPTLRARLACPVSRPGPIALAEQGRILWLDAFAPDQAALRPDPVLHIWRGAVAESSHELAGVLELHDASCTLQCAWPWVWVVQNGASAVRVNVFRVEGGFFHAAHLELEGARRAAVRVADSLLLACDDVGRVLRVDLHSGEHTTLRL